MLSTDPVEAEALFDARRLAYPALEQRGMAMLTEDVCLPRGKVAEMLARIEAIGVAHETTIATVAHAGDGNLHPLMLTPHGDAVAKTRAQAAFHEIIAPPSSWAPVNPRGTGRVPEAGRQAASSGRRCWPCTAS